VRSFLACIVVAAALAAPAAAPAATIVVDSEEALSATDCGLANAITAANTNAKSGGCNKGDFLIPDRIEFALPQQATITLGAPLPTISSQLAIVGPGAGQLVVSGGDAFRVFTIKAVGASISDLTIADGKAETGGGLRNESGSSLELVGVTLRGNEANVPGPFPGGGGAIWNLGTLSLTESLVSENVARSPERAIGGGIVNQLGSMTITRSTIDRNEAVSTSTGANGGGIFDSAQLTLRDSTVSRNKAVASAVPLLEAIGGGILVETPGASTIERSTIVANSVATSAGGTQFGGGFATTSTATQAISASTLAGNFGPASNVYNTGLVTFRSTILADPSGTLNCWLPAISLGFNLEEGDSCELEQPSDQKNTDPLLAPGLAANGGPTETIALLKGSPAIDRGISLGPETSDQRGLRRPVEIASMPNALGGNGADVGAYEIQVPRTTIVSGPGEGETVGDASPSFGFVADEAGAGFLCSLDGSAAAACTSPFQLQNLAGGPHTFTVAALGSAGYAEDPPKTRTFSVDTPQPEPPRRDETAPSSSPPTKPPETIVPAAPRASIGKLPARTSQRQLTIRFSSDQPGSTFSCKLDGRKWRGCRSPYKTPELALGEHTFRVKATGPAGQPDATPAKRSFRVIAPPRGG